MLKCEKLPLFMALEQLSLAVPRDRKIQLSESLNSICGSIVNKSQQVVANIKEGLDVRKSLIVNNWNKPLNAIYVDDLERIISWGPILAPYLAILAGVAVDNFSDYLHSHLGNHIPPNEHHLNSMMLQQPEPSATPATPDANSCYHLPEGHSLWQFAYEQSEADPSGWGNWESVLAANAHLNTEHITPQDCVYHPSHLPQPTIDATPILVTPESANSCLIHQIQVQDGDTLSGIAVEHNWDWTQTQTANQELIQQGVIHPGDCVNPPGYIASPAPEIARTPTVEALSSVTPMPEATITCNIPPEQVTPVFEQTTQTLSQVYSSLKLDEQVVYNGSYLANVCRGIDDYTANQRAYTATHQYIIEKSNSSNTDPSIWPLVRIVAIPVLCLPVAATAAGVAWWKRRKSRRALEES